MTPHLIVIAGPTASGKTELSLSLAEHLGAEIFSADARQFYRGMDIGTAKPKQAEQARVPHHFIDILEPNEEYSAGRYAEDLQTALTTYFKQKSTAIVVGGSGFYIKAATEGLDALPRADEALRAKWNAIYTAEGLDGLQERLKQADPAYFEEVDIQNRQRVQRALEAIEISGKPFSALRKGEQEALPWKTTFVVVEWEREALYDRINARVDQMMAAGLMEEAKALYPLREHNALQTVGYKELFDYLDGVYTEDEAIAKIKQHTRNYAKRQMTWFRKQPVDIHLKEASFKSLLRQL
jgi:tRNA dimethylallyltransferase